MGGRLRGKAMFGGVGGSEVLLVVLLVLVLFGSKRMPEFARGCGKMMRDFRRAVDDIKREIEHPTPPEPPSPTLPSEPSRKDAPPAG
jgi:sec-independent protein translocase protein TatA